MVAWLPEISVTKSGDIITVAIQQRYMARGYKVAHRWRIAGQYSLKQLEKEESDLKKEVVEKIAER
jgi:hypothetical protein